MFCSIETCRNALRRAAGDPGAIGPAGATLAAERGHAEALAPAGRQPGERREHRRGPHANAWSAQAS